MSGEVYALVEAGGTKFVVAAARSPTDILRKDRIDTTAPEPTIAQMMRFFASVVDDFGPLRAAGVASFGPADIDPASRGWGCILATPKPGWSGTDMVGPIAHAFGCPVGFDTDVNAAALAEARWGAARDARLSTYVTIGTGIGGGVAFDGHSLHGSRHPEMGHTLPPRHPADRDFVGVCPFHGACFEGLASGPAVKARWGSSLSELPTDHEAHEIVGWYLAHLVVAQQALLSPDRIVLGGGVMQTEGLLDRVRRMAATVANGYFGVDRPGYDDLVRSPGLGSLSGLLGALVLAQTAETSRGPSTT